MAELSSALSFLHKKHIMHRFTITSHAFDLKIFFSQVIDFADVNLFHFHAAIPVSSP
jgi:hypothetical protein